MDDSDLLNHWEFARSIARSLVADDHEAEDVAQDAVLGALRRPPQGANVRGWFLAVARRLAMRVRRGHARRVRREEMAARPETVPSTDESVARLEAQRRVVGAVLSLAEPYRSAVIGRFLHGMTVVELARSLGVPADTVRTRIRRALEQMRARLDRLYGGDRAAWSLALVPLFSLGRGDALLAGATLMAKKTLLLALGAAVAGSALTLAVVPRATRDERALPAEKAELRRQLDATREELVRVQAERDEARERLDRVPRDAPPGPQDAATRRLRIDELARQVDGWFERGFAAAALAALRELVALETDGWPLAMELWVRIRDDSGRDSALGLSDMAAAGALNDPALIRVMAWALDNPAPQAFREHAAWDLPWRREPTATLVQFRRLLPTEADADVSWALLDGLAGLGTAEARAALVTIVGDRSLGANLRGMVATRLVDLARWLTHDAPSAPAGADLVRAVQDVAGGDPAADARAAAGAALEALRPSSVSGFLVTGFRQPGSVGEASGLRPGDLIVAYGGSSVSAFKVLWPLMESWHDGPKTVEISVLRGGGQVTLTAPRAPLGIYGLDVEAR